MNIARGQSALAVGGQEVSVHFLRVTRARRYILRLREDGSLRVTVPRRGSQREAWAFVTRSRAWIARQLQRRQSRPVEPRIWEPGTAIWWRGEQVRLEVGADHQGSAVRFADQTIALAPAAILRAAVESHLWQVARRELPGRVLELAARHHLSVSRVTVRNQRSRWGSCSRRGTISLNWRLIQAPDFVRDYLILHELMHLREMNHSRRFWQAVAAVCPAAPAAEQWLKQHRSLLR